jgi:heme-degrading monooxygenase HmoA
MATTVACVLVIMRFQVDAEDDDFKAEAAAALGLLAARPGYRGGQLIRAFDEPGHWCLVTEWGSVGDYRRALGSYEVKAGATPLLSRALPEPSAFEPLAEAGPGGPVTLHDSDRSIASRT